jgi:hypothetical protein
MDQTTQVLLSVGIPTVAVLVGILVNNHRLTDMKADLRDRFGVLQSHMDRRFDQMQRQMDARFDAARSDLLRVEGVMDARLKHLEDEQRGR